jgi:hypothetical protein
MGKGDPLKTFGIILPAVAEMMDEQKLSKCDAMAALRLFLGADEQPAAVADAIARLDSIEDELEFRAMLGEECLRALGLRGSEK